MYLMHDQCDYDYLPSRKASLPIGHYQIILLGDRGTRVLTNLSRFALDSGEPSI